MEDKQVGTELKAALAELRQLASQLVNNSRDWFETRRYEMNHGNKHSGPSRDPRRDDRSAHGYGEGSRESDADVRSQYGGGQRSSYEQGRSFDDRAYGAGRREPGRFGQERESGYYSRPGRAEGGEYSQGYGRDRDPGRAYGPEDFSQRYVQQGDVFDDGGYGDAGQFADSNRNAQGDDWRHRGGPSVSGSWRSGTRSSVAGASAYGGYAENDRNQQNFRGRGPRGYTRSDERITEDLNERLTDDWQLDADDIQVAVSGGVVTLSGSVEQRWLKHHAENLAEACSGVKDVRNELRVSGSRATSGNAKSESASSGTAGNAGKDTGSNTF
ncbi:MAG TPA: BON domain-containing protein [Pseudoxanthomonas sp.]|nr:BON domain-containing protein [Pseudoxanthomonas sp.]